MKEVLILARAELCFPSHRAGPEVQPTDQAVTRANIYEVAYDRRRVRESSARGELPYGRLIGECFLRIGTARHEQNATQYAERYS